MQIIEQGAARSRPGRVAVRVAPAQSRPVRVLAPLAQRVRVRSL